MPTTKWTYANLLNPAPRWDPHAKDNVTLWHGCTSDDADNIWNFGVDLTKCREDTDFGRGFYLTQIERQARHWAWIRYYDLPLPDQRVNQPKVLEFILKRAHLAPLHSLSFVSGAFENEGYWSLVQHCRQSPKQPHHLTHLYSTTGWYDLVYGPVSAFWYQRIATHDEDQVSFHTADAVQVLNDFIDSRRNSGDKSWIKPVP
jgi:uncharacterized protein DUF3990